MDLSYLLFAAGLATVLASVVNLALSPVWTRLREPTLASGREIPFIRQITALLLQVTAGIVLGFVYWLSWGFAAVVGVSWWQRGIAFALALWCAACLPVLTMQVITSRSRAPAALVSATEWLITFLAVGLACSWAWAKGP